MKDLRGVLVLGQEGLEFEICQGGMCRIAGLPSHILAGGPGCSWLKATLTEPPAGWKSGLDGMLLRIRRASGSIWCWPGCCSPKTATPGLDVLRLLAAGAPNPCIAAELVVSLDTVKKHVSHLLGKLGAANRTEAVTRAVSSA